MKIQATREGVSRQNRDLRHAFEASLQNRGLSKANIRHLSVVLVALVRGIALQYFLQEDKLDMKSIRKSLGWLLENKVNL